MDQQKHWFLTTLLKNLPVPLIRMRVVECLRVQIYPSALPIVYLQVNHNGELWDCRLDHFVRLWVASAASDGDAVEVEFYIFDETFLYADSFITETLSTQLGLNTVPSESGSVWMLLRNALQRW